MPIVIPDDLPTLDDLAGNTQPRAGGRRCRLGAIAERRTEDGADGAASRGEQPESSNTRGAARVQKDNGVEKAGEKSTEMDAKQEPGLRKRTPGPGQKRRPGGKKGARTGGKADASRSDGSTQVSPLNGSRTSDSRKDEGVEEAVETVLDTGTEKMAADTATKETATENAKKETASDTAAKEISADTPTKETTAENMMKETSINITTKETSADSATKNTSAGTATKETSAKPTIKETSTKPTTKQAPRSKKRRPRTRNAPKTNDNIQKSPPNSGNTLYQNTAIDKIIKKPADTTTEQASGLPKRPAATRKPLLKLGDDANISRSDVNTKPPALNGSNTLLKDDAIREVVEKPAKAAAKHSSGLQKCPPSIPKSPEFDNVERSLWDDDITPQNNKISPLPSLNSSNPLPNDNATELVVEKPAEAATKQVFGLPKRPSPIQKSPPKIDQNERSPQGNERKSRNEKRSPQTSLKCDSVLQQDGDIEEAVEKSTKIATKQGSGLPKHPSPVQKTPKTNNDERCPQHNRDKSLSDKCSHLPSRKYDGTSQQDGSIKEAVEKSTDPAIRQALAAQKVQALIQAPCKPEGAVPPASIHVSPIFTRVHVEGYPWTGLNRNGSLDISTTSESSGHNAPPNMRHRVRNRDRSTSGASERSAPENDRSRDRSTSGASEHTAPKKNGSTATSTSRKSHHTTPKSPSGTRQSQSPSMTTTAPSTASFDRASTIEEFPDEPVPPRRELDTKGPRPIFKTRKQKEAEIYHEWEHRARHRNDKWLQVGPMIGFWGSCVILAGQLFWGWMRVQRNKYCLVMEDLFNETGLDRTKWFAESSFSGFGVGQFAHMTNRPENLFIENGTLMIKPTLEFAPYIEIPGSVDLRGRPGGCTGTEHDDCVATTNHANGSIINPVLSARISTKFSTSIQYGRVEVVARLPAGDWLWPSFVMLPADEVYGGWPQSGQIDMVQGRGNGFGYEAGRGGNNVVGSCLHYGPSGELDRCERNMKRLAAVLTSYAETFHRFGVEWNQNYIYMYVDNRLWQVLYTDFKTPFWDVGQFPTADHNRTRFTNPWEYSDNPRAAPFDQPFFLVIQLLAGGTNGWFKDGVGGKPWVDSDRDAMRRFWRARHAWWPSWERKGWLEVRSVRMWQEAGWRGCGGGEARRFYG